jgi:4-amino-4-deoxy-L-arabinose transferase-like glycosyltransferase
MIRAQFKSDLALEIALASLALSLLFAASFPMVTDEAYYIDWARASDWPSLGFFDHPPVVSWIGALSRFSNQIFVARLGVWVCAVLTAFFTWRLAKKILPSRASTAAALFTSSIGGLASGFLLTPDAGLMLAWSLALHEGFCALHANPKRWLTAGLATGFGILSKYTMVLIGPVFLIALLRSPRRQLKSIWPYLGGVACLTVLIPHLWWQHNNDWITFRFQLRHGLSIHHQVYSRSELPRANEALIGSSAYAAKDRLMTAMNDVQGFAEAIKKPKRQLSRLERAWQYVGDYIGGVAALWGAYALIGLIYFVLKRIRPLPNKNTGHNSASLTLIKSSVLVPLIFFGLLSPFTKIEANWPAMHMMGLAVWIAVSSPINPKLIFSAFGLHVTLFLSLVLVLLKPDWLPQTRNNRLLLESRGFQSLGHWTQMNSLQMVLAVDSYQLKSTLRFHAPNLEVLQWPGFTRDSEYTRGRDIDLVLERKIRDQKHFSVISNSDTPMTIPGFEATSFRGIRVCADGTIGIFSEADPRLPCEKGLREWWITEYTNQKP